MALKNNLSFFVIGVLVMFLSGCKTTKEIDEKYLVVSNVAIAQNVENHSLLTLKIEGDYAESAWGIKNIKQETIGNTILLTGTLVLEGQGSFEYDVNIPPNVDIVKFYNKVLWMRNK